MGIKGKYLRKSPVITSSNRQGITQSFLSSWQKLAYLNGSWLIRVGVHIQEFLCARNGHDECKRNNIFQLACHCYFDLIQLKGYVQIYTITFSGGSGRQLNTLYICRAKTVNLRIEI